MWQAEHVRDRLLTLKEVEEVEIVGMTTKGDQILDRSLSKIGGKGLFIKELEVALLEGRADLAVHSGKDIPMDLDAGFKLCGFMPREVPTDAFVSNNFEGLDGLPKGAVVGSSSLRRQAQILAKYPHLVVKPLRGNLDTRLGKLDAGEYQAIVLATAGLKRLKLESRIRAEIPPESMLPAVGQGALGLEIRATDHGLAELVKPLICDQTTKLVSAERFVSKALGGSCQVPIAGYAILTSSGGMNLRGLVSSVCGTRVAYASQTGSIENWSLIAEQVVEDLLSQGAADLMSEAASL